MRVGIEIVTMLYMRRIVKSELNALFAGSGINGSYIDQLTLLFINVIKRSKLVKLGCHYLAL
jgi:hypothetical protein